MYKDKIELFGATSKHADLRKYHQVEALIDAYGPFDGIIHVAANVGGLYKNMLYPVEMLEDNLLMNTNILRAAHKANIDHVVCFLSTCIFPDEVRQYPIGIEDLHQGPPHPSNEGYAYAKRMMEVQCRAYQRQYHRRYFCVVPTNIYGPNDNFDIENAHVIPALIHKCYLAKRNNEPFVVAGDGSSLRQFIYSEDVAKLVLWAYLCYNEIHEPLILCPPLSDGEFSIEYVATCIAEAFEYKDHIMFDTSRSNGQYRKTADYSQLQKLGHGTAFTRFSDGLKTTVEWFIHHHDSHF